MLSNLDNLLRAVVFATPVVAGILLICALFVEDCWRIIGSGLSMAAIFAIVGLAIVGGKLGSEEGWGFVALGAMVLIGIYICAGFVFGVGLRALGSSRFRWSSPVLLLFGILSPVAIPIHGKIQRLESERKWTEKQEAIRRAPHALVDDSPLAETEDSGYRVRFVDDTGAVREHPDRPNSYVVIPTGKHRLALHGDTPKAKRLKLTWFLQQEVEVEEGCFYILGVERGEVFLRKIGAK